MSRIRFAVAAAAALSACGGDSFSGPTAANSSIDLNAVLKQVASGGLTGTTAAAAGIFAPTTVTSPDLTAGCAYSITTGGFVCPTRTANGLTISVVYYLFDAAGRAQSAFDPKSTAAVRGVTNMTGAVSMSSDTLVGTTQLTQHVDMTMSGLQTDTHVMNGVTKAHFEVNFTKPAIVGTTDMTTTTTGLRFPAMVDPARPWPISGTLITDETSNVAALPLAATPVTSHMVLAFNGTSIASLTISVFGSAGKTCQIDLTGKNPMACS